LQDRLLNSWKYIPIEVAPIAAHRVLRELKKIGSIDPVIRLRGDLKEGPMKTDQDFFIIDAPFKPLLTTSDVAAGKNGSGANGVWEVNALSKTIKQIPGVLDVGLFSGFTGPQDPTSPWGPQTTSC
jgi:ribose 5-phosphate isomerase A